MYQYTFSNEDSEKIKDKTEKYSDLLDKFKQVDDKYNKSDDGPLELEKKTFTPLSEDEIKKRAEDSLYEYKENGKANINDEYELKQKNIDEQISSSKTNADEKKKETQALYSSLKKDASNDATKRGLARSSIVINILDAFDQNMINEYNKINEEISAKVESLTSEKNLLSEQRENALNNFDLDHAIKLSNKIDEINTELANEEQKVLEYNNQIAQKEAEYEEKRHKNALDYAEFLKKNGYSSIEDAMQSEKYYVAYDYLMSLPKEEAQKAIDDTFFSSNLGSWYWSKLKREIDYRKE